MTVWVGALTREFWENTVQSMIETCRCSHTLCIYPHTFYWYVYVTCICYQVQAYSAHHGIGQSIRDQVLGWGRDFIREPADQEDGRLKRKSCLTLCDPVDYTVRGILQARTLEWIAVPFSRGSSQPRDRTQVSCTVGRFFTSWATGKPKNTGVGSLSLLQGIW